MNNRKRPTDTQDSGITMDTNEKTNKLSYYGHRD